MRTAPSGLGRTDDMLKVSGQWVSPLDVEAVSLAVEGVRECGVVGCPGRGRSHRGGRVRGRGRSPRTRCRTRIAAACEPLPRYKRPKRIVFLEVLPRTPTGKLQRVALRDAVLARPR